MATKKTKSLLDMTDSLTNIGNDVNSIVKPLSKKQTGRPKQNPYDEDKKLTVRVPADVHRQLRFASVDLDKPMVEIVVEALKKHLKAYEGK